MMYKRILTSAASIALLAGVSTPAFARFDVEYRSRRAIINSTEAYNRSQHRQTMQSRTVRQRATDSVAARRRLLRGTIDNRENSNSQPKAGTARYRQLNIRPATIPNTRNLRNTIQRSQSSLPVNLVITGSNDAPDTSAPFDRPTRRTIRNNR